MVWGEEERRIQSGPKDGGLAALAPAAPGPLRRAEDIPLARRLIAFAFFLYADFFYGWAWNTVDVLRPYMRDSLGLTLQQAGALYSAQSAGALIGAIVIGQLADRLGRRNALVGIMVGYSLGMLLASFSSNFETALFSRFVIGLFLGGIFPVVVGLYTGLFERRTCGKLASFYNGTFNGSVVLLGAAVSHLGGQDWRQLLLLGAIPALVAAPLAFVLAPNDRKIEPYGGWGGRSAVAKLPILELFAPDLRRRTLLLALMVGLNFFAYQAFNGWMTTYLTDVRKLPSEVVGALVSWQFVGAITGGFFWGWLSDRFGRKGNALGFVVASLLIVVFLTIPNNETLLIGAGLVYGFALSASVIWGPWIAELYPPHLRSTAASIFNWGRIISFFAPLVTAAVAETFGLSAAMMMGALSFAGAAAIWLTLPETIGARPKAR